MHVYILVLTITRPGDMYLIFSNKQGVFIHGHSMMFFWQK